MKNRIDVDPEGKTTVVTIRKGQGTVYGIPLRSQAIGHPIVKELSFGLNPGAGHVLAKSLGALRPTIKAVGHTRNAGDGSPDLILKI